MIFIHDFLKIIHFLFASFFAIFYTAHDLIFHFSARKLYRYGRNEKC